MATLTLTPEQVEVLAEVLSGRLNDILDNATADWEAGPLLDALEKADPLKEALSELIGQWTIADLSLASDLAREALSNHRDSAGGELSTVEAVKAGRVAEYRTDADEAAEQIIQRARANAERDAALAARAEETLWAIRLAENERDAEAGKPGAAEQVRWHKRMAEENRQYAAEAS